MPTPSPKPFLTLEDLAAPGGLLDGMRQDTLNRLRRAAAYDGPVPLLQAAAREAQAILDEDAEFMGDTP